MEFTVVDAGGAPLHTFVVADADLFWVAMNLDYLQSVITVTGGHDMRYAYNADPRKMITA
jgi:hypothetical protein